MAEPVTLGGIAILVISNMALWIEKIGAARRRNGKNGASKKLCEDHTKKLDEHGTAITELKTHRKNMDDKIDLWRKENREDHKSLFDKLDGLSK
jgi:hypothetical protein